MRLSDICNVYSGYAFKTFNDLGHGVPVIKISNLLPDGSIDLINCLFTTDNFKEKFYSKKNDIYSTVWSHNWEDRYYGYR